MAESHLSGDSGHRPIALSKLLSTQSSRRHLPVPVPWHDLGFNSVFVELQRAKHESQLTLCVE